MATAGGPNIERDGLVFGYDTSYGINTNNISSRFYEGANITNNSNTTAITTYWNNSGTAAWSSNDTEVPRLFSDLPVFSMEKLTNGNSHIGLGSTSATVSTVYTYSIYIWIKPGNSIGMSGISPYFRPQPANSYLGPLTYNGSSSWSTWPRGRWIRISITATTPSNVTSAYISCYLDTAGDKVYFTAPQFTSKNFLSPFVNGTRSSTQSLIDLTRTTNIDVSNVSFDSTGQPTFDGTNDRIYIPNSTFTNPTELTIESVFKRTSALPDAVGCPIHRNDGSNGNVGNSEFTIAVYRDNSYYIYGSIGANTGTATWTNGYTGVICEQDIYYHVTSTWDGSNVRTYVNGDLKVTYSLTTYSNSGGNIRFGTSSDNGGTYRWLGEIPITKIYNRALTAQEVQQNYRAYKNRFNI